MSGPVEIASTDLAGSPVPERSLLNLPEEILIKILRFLLVNGEPVGARNGIFPCQHRKQLRGAESDCRCSLIELSAQVLSTCQAIRSIGEPFLYTQNTWRITASSHSRALLDDDYDANTVPNFGPDQDQRMSINHMEFNLWGVEPSILAETGKDGVHGLHFARDIRAELTDQTWRWTHPSDDLMRGAVDGRRLLAHWTALNRISSISVDVIYRDIRDVYTTFASLRSVLRCKNVTLRPRRFPGSEETEENEVMQNRSLLGCSVVRCRTFEVQRIPEPADSDLVGFIDSVATQRVLSELRTLVTSELALPDLWQLWKRSVQSIELVPNVPGLTRTEIQANKQILDCIYRSDRLGYKKRRDELLANIEQTVELWHIQMRVFTFGFDYDQTGWT